MLALASWTALVLLTIVVSQPLFYWLALGRATQQLDALAYVALRQQINAAITQRLTRLYIATLLSLIALVATALVQSAWPLACGACVAAAALIADAVLALKLNVPINTRMDSWTPATIPGDWQAERSHWDRALAVRRAVLLVGFAALSLALFAQR